MSNQCEGQPGPAQSSSWVNFVSTLLPQPDVNRAKFVQLDEIVAILDQLGRDVPDVHWAFLPGGESIEIARASMGAEPECMQIESREGGLFVCKPESLVCFRFSKALEMSYLDLALQSLLPMDDTNLRTDKKEDCYGEIRGADGTTRKDDFTRLLSGRLIVGTKDEWPRELEGIFDWNLMSRKRLRRCMEFEANGRLDL
jgi:hypothetical protein